MKAEQFNKEFPLYTRVWYVRRDGKKSATTVQGQAWDDEDGETYVALHGYPKAVALRITKFDKE